MHLKSQLFSMLTASNPVDVVVNLTGSGIAFAGGTAIQFVTLTGYELDCTAAACAPIATQYGVHL